MRNSWSDLFVLGLAQISSQVSIPPLLSIIVSHQQTRLARENTPINVKEVTASICKIHDYVQTLGKLNISATEFAYLRSIALFGAGNNFRQSVSLTISDQRQPVLPGPAKFSQPFNLSFLVLEEMSHQTEECNTVTPATTSTNNGEIFAGFVRGSPGCFLCYHDVLHPQSLS